MYSRYHLLLESQRLMTVENVQVGNVIKALDTHGPGLRVDELRSSQPNIGHMQLHMRSINVLMPWTGSRRCGRWRCRIAYITHSEDHREIGYGWRNSADYSSCTRMDFLKFLFRADECVCLAALSIHSLLPLGTTTFQMLMLDSARLPKTAADTNRRAVQLDWC